MYIDYTNLNKDWPKDCFLLSKFDMMVDAIANHEMMSFLNAFSSKPNYCINLRHIKSLLFPNFYFFNKKIYWFLLFFLL